MVDVKQLRLFCRFLALYSIIALMLRAAFRSGPVYDAFIFYFDSSASEFELWFPDYHHAAYLLMLLLKMTVYCGLAATLWMVWDVRMLFVRFATRHRVNIGILVLSILGSMLLAEIPLRMMGYAPGRHTPAAYFNEVDSLWVKKGFVTDSAGIFRIDEDAQMAIWEMVARDSFSILPIHSEAYYTAIPSVLSWNGRGDREVDDAYRAAMSLRHEERTPIQNALIHFVDSAVNMDGFRSIAFRPVENNKPSVLLLGDSFTYGHSASFLHNSFADLLLSRGYTVYNTGITGTDVAQYLAIARHWIPRLRPDVVIVNFYIGNDIAYFKREVGPENPVLFPTNAGNLMACPEGVYLRSPEESYALCLYWMCIQRTRGFERLMSLTTATSAFYGLLWRKGLIHLENDHVRSYYSKKEEVVLPFPYSRIQLQQIDSVALANCAKTIVSVIPSVDRWKKTVKAEDFPDAFSGIDYVQMEVTRDDYKLSDGHFNDRGHRRYADFLQKLIDEQ